MIKSFKELSTEYKELLEGAKLLKVRKFIPNQKGELVKTLKKFCVDSDGQRAKGYKLVDGKKCVKMTPEEIRNKFKTIKKANKTKKRRSSILSQRADKIKKRRISKGLTAKPQDD